MKKILIGLLLPLIMIAGELPEDKRWAVGLHIAPLPSIGASYYWHAKALEFELYTAYGEDSTYVGKNLETSTTDLHVRKYTSGKIGGVYVSAFTRLSHMDGALRNDYRAAKITKLGFGVGVGYRTFFNIQSATFYWSVGINIGAFVLGQNDVYRHDGLWDVGFNDDDQGIVNIDLLKFGYTF